MALIDCGECGKQISDKAVSCPHCGNPSVTRPAPETDSLRDALSQAILQPVAGENFITHSYCLEQGFSAPWRKTINHVWLSNLRLVFTDMRTPAFFGGISLVPALIEHFEAKNDKGPRILWQCAISQIEAAVRIEKYALTKVYVLDLPNVEKRKISMYGKDIEQLRIALEPLGVVIPTAK